MDDGGIAPTQTALHGPTRRRRALWTVAVLVAVVGGALGTFAAFTATTANSGNSISSGTVKIDQHSGSTALYNASNTKPGASTTGCVRVTYAGSLPAIVRLYASSGAISNGSGFTLEVERGSGLTAPNASMGCAGFNPSSTVYSGSLAGFPSGFAAGRTGKANGATWTPNEQVDYRFTIAPTDDTSANAHTSALTTSSHAFTWEAQSVGDYASTILSTSGLQSYWRFGESSGTVAADATGRAPGTYVRAPTLGAQGLVAGDTDTGGVFNATKYADVGDRYDFAGTQAFSFEAWIKKGTATDYRRIATKQDWTALTGWQLRVTPDPNYKLSFVRQQSGGSYTELYANTPMLAGQRHHVVATYDGSTMRIYVDGVLENSRASSLTVGDHAQPLTLGSFDDGTLDDASVYDRALTAGEVQAHFNAGK